MINDSIPYSLVVRGKALLLNLRHVHVPEGIPEGNNLCRGLNKRPIPHITSEYLLYHTEKLFYHNYPILLFDDVVKLFSVTDALIMLKIPSKPIKLQEIKTWAR